MVVYSPLNFAPAEPPPPPPPTVGQHTLTELLSFVRAAEQAFAGIVGLSDLHEQYHALRGIYYGTTWSLDYQINQSTARNFGFQSFCQSGVPPDVRSILGPTLHTNLYECAEVKLTPTISLDFGHLIIGLDARRSYLARTVPHPIALGGGTGLEACTWLGDIAGGAGQLAFRRVTTPNRRALAQFQGHDFGAAVNLEGDIAAFLVGAPTGSLSSVPRSPDTGRLSDMLAAYCQVGSSIWQARVAAFLQLLGAELSGTTVENLENLRQSLYMQCQRMGEAYLINRVKGLPLSSSEAAKMLYDAARHLVGASHEMIDIFLDLLLRSLLSPAGALAPAILDPNPTPMGPPFRRYENTRRGIQSYERRLKEASEWLKMWPR